MISDKERRDVVRKLREPKDSLLAYPDDELIRLRHEVKCSHSQDLYERLADLIEHQTCTFVSVMFRDDYNEYEVELSCGDSIRWLGDAKEVAFCPICGAEVIEETRDLCN